MRWTADQGAPDAVFRINQTPDGYLWLGGDALYRFDGAAFERIPWPPSAPKHAWLAELMVSRRGELWVGLSNKGGVAVYRRGRLVDMRMPKPLRTVGALAQTTDGTIWAASTVFDGELRRWRAGHWASVGRELGSPPGAVSRLLAAPDGGLWASLTHQDGQSGAIAYLAPHATRFRQLPQRFGGRPKIAFDPQGALWVADATGARMLFDRNRRSPASPIRVPSPPNVRNAWPVFDQGGGMWQATGSVGILRVPPRTTPGAVGSSFPFSAANGLTSDTTYQPFVDREGSVWIGTEGGLDQFRRAAATQELSIPADPVDGLAIAGAADGSVYIESHQTVYRVEPGHSPRPILKLAPGNTSICAGRDDGIWVIGSAATLRVHGDRAAVFPPYPGREAPVDCAEDRWGRLWLSMLDGKLDWRDTRGWHSLGMVPASGPVWSLIGTPWGDPAFDALGSKVGIIHAGGVAVTDMARAGMGLQSTIAAGRRDLFIGHERGLIRVRAGRWQRLTETQFGWLSDLRSLTQTARGETWLIGRNAVSRVATADLDRAFDNAQAPLKRTRFDTQDGLISATQHPGFTGIQSAVGGDGRVWLLNRQGAAYFDPATLRQNTLAPPVAIRSLVSGGRHWRDPIQLVLPPGTRAVDIAYAGLSLAVPQRVRFRYRLEGLDEGWVDAGTRRTASYANLAPARYRFHVIAANNDGVWNTGGATLDFDIRPTFLESLPFKLICAAAVVALLWLAYAMRLRVVAGRIRLRMAERMAERERIARELHDTLLQSVQSLTLRFQMAADDLPRKMPGRAGLEHALDEADRVIAEGRDRVHDLRAIQDGDVGQIMRDIVARQGFPPGVEIEIARTGASRTFQPLTLDEVGRIAGEAIFNIRRHAHATKIAIAVEQGRDFHLRIIDNGVGIDPAVLADHGKPGHFGLSGMRERARKLRGVLVVRCPPSGGTELLLTIPGSVAYKRTRGAPLALFRRPG